jgi:hypothetical protein
MQQGLLYVIQRKHAKLAALEREMLGDAGGTTGKMMFSQAHGVLCRRRAAQLKADANKLGANANIDHFAPLDNPKPWDSFGTRKP